MIIISPNPVSPFLRSNSISALACFSCWPHHIEAQKEHKLFASTAPPPTTTTTPTTNTTMSAVYKYNNKPKKHRMTLSKFLERDSSVATLETEASSSASTDGQSLSAAVPQKSARFATTDNGNVLCEVRLFETCDNPELWWQPEEAAATRAQCTNLVKSKTQNQRYLRAATVNFLQGGDGDDADVIHEMKSCPDERGLEFHIVRECSKIIKEQRSSMFDVQRTTSSESLLRLASRAQSQAFVELALLRAQYDAEEAEKVYQEEYHGGSCARVPFLD